MWSALLVALPAVAHGYSLQMRAPGAAARVRSTVVASAAGTTAAGAIAGFWEEVVEARRSNALREATLVVTDCKDEALLLEYMNSCSEQLFGGDTCSVTSESSAAAGTATISLRIEPAASDLADEARMAAAGGETADHSRESALELMMEWFTAQLMA